MTDTTDTAKPVTEWVNLAALTTPDELVRRQMLAASGRALLPAVFDWVRDAVPLAQWPALGLEGQAQDAIHDALGIGALDDVRYLLDELVRVFDVPETDVNRRIADLGAAHPELTRSPAPVA